MTLANAGVPMLMVYAPVLVVAFLPIVAIEAFWVKRRLSDLPTRAVVTSIATANAVSSLVGVPLTWLTLVAFQLGTGGGSAHGTGWVSVTWQAPWLIPYERELHWMIPTAGLVLCVPFAIASAFVESAVVQRMLGSHGEPRIRRQIWIANGITYGMLAVFWGALSLLAVID